LKYGDESNFGKRNFGKRKFGVWNGVEIVVNY
jgi:hypothetical protein